MSIFARLARLIEKRPWAVVAICLAVTLVLGIGLMFLHGEVTYQALLPKGFPSIQALNALGEKFGGISYSYVLVKAPSITDPKITEFLIGLDDRLAEDPRFNEGQIETLTDSSGNETLVIQDYLSPFIANIRNELKSRGFDVPLSTITNETVKLFAGKDFRELVEQDYLPNPSVQKSIVGRFITPDNKAALIMLKVNPDLGDLEMVKLGNDLEDFFGEGLGQAGATVSVSGDPTLARDFDLHIKNKTALLFGVAMLFVIAMLFLAFRRFTDTLLPIGFMVLGLVWTFGFMGWIGIQYSIAAVAIMPLLLGTALTFIVPLMARYYEEMGDTFRSVQSVGKAVMTVGVGVFLAAITNVFGFLVFEFSILPPLRDFGLTCAMGTVFIFGLSVTLLPAIMVLRDRSYEKGTDEMRAKLQTHFDGLSRRKKRGIFARATDRGLEAFNALAVRHSTLVIIVFVILIGAGFSQIRGLTTDSDLRKLVPRSLPGIQADFEIEDYFGGQQQDVVMIEGDMLAPESLAAMARLEDSIAEDERNQYGKTKLYERASITGLPDALSEANNGVLPATREEAEAALEAAEANGGYITGGLLSADHQAALVTLNAPGAESTEVVDRKMEILDSDTKKALEGTGLSYRLGGITPLTKDMTRNIIPTETLSSILSLVLCALILIIIFKSLPYGLITLTVAFTGVAAEIGFLALMNWPLDVVTSLVSALVIGIGVNFGILFTHRYMQEIKTAERRPVDAIRTTMMNLGRANVVAAVATVAAFLIVMLSDIVPLRRFGGVTAFAIGWCLISSLTLMPALLLRLSGHREAVKGPAVSEPTREPA